VLAGFALQRGQFALFAATVEFFGAPIYPHLPFGYQSVVLTG
jgi:hypothetical protein